MSWFGVKDGDPRAVVLFERHYSCRNGKRNHARYGFSGPGESMILLTQDCKALFGWRKQKVHDDGQEGINCFIFRNEGDELSSQLIKEAVSLALARWGNERLFTYVDSHKIRSANPGACFLKAGWKRLKKQSKRGLTILELTPY